MISSELDLRRNKPKTLQNCLFNSASYLHQLTNSHNLNTNTANSVAAPTTGLSIGNLNNTTTTGLLNSQIPANMFSNSMIHSYHQNTQSQNHIDSNIFKNYFHALFLLQSNGKLLFNDFSFEINS